MTAGAPGAQARRVCLDCKGRRETKVRLGRKVPRVRKGLLARKGSKARKARSGPKGQPEKLDQKARAVSQLLGRRASRGTKVIREQPEQQGPLQPFPDLKGRREQQACKERRGHKECKDLKACRVTTARRAHKARQVSRGRKGRKAP